MWKNLAGAVLGLPLLVIAGCAVGPDYVRPSVVTPVAFKELEGWKAAQPRDDIPRGRWWELYQDPLLNMPMNHSQRVLAACERGKC